MDYKVRITAKSQNRTALGIVSAYCRMNPGTTLDSLRTAFPNTLCPDAGVKELFLPVAEAETFNDKMGLYFTKADETITLRDKKTVALAQVWSKQSLGNIVAKAAAYGIEAADPDKNVKAPGGFDIECLGGYAFPKAGKGCFGILLLPLIAAGALAWLLA